MLTLKAASPFFVVFCTAPSRLVLCLDYFNSSFFLCDSIGDCENHGRVSAEGEEEEAVCAEHQEAKHKPL